jgi:hypothetical protein
MNSNWVSDCIITNNNLSVLIDIVVFNFIVFFFFHVLMDFVMGFCTYAKGKIPSLMTYNSCKIFVKARYEQHTFMIVII